MKCLVKLSFSKNTMIFSSKQKLMKFYITGSKVKVKVTRLYICTAGVDMTDYLEADVNKRVLIQTERAKYSKFCIKGLRL